MARPPWCEPLVTLLVKYFMIFIWPYPCWLTCHVSKRRYRQRQATFNRHLLVFTVADTDTQKPGDHPKSQEKTLSEWKGHSRSSRRVPGYSRSSSRNSETVSQNAKSHSQNGTNFGEHFGNFVSNFAMFFRNFVQQKGGANLFWGLPKLGNENSARSSSDRSFLNPPWGHGRPRLRVMDVRTAMLVFPGLQAPDRSFCPRRPPALKTLNSLIN